MSPLPALYKGFNSGSTLSFDEGGEGATASELESDSEADGGQQAAYWLEQARAHSAAAEVLLQRKRMKRRLALAAQRFNTDAKGWMGYAQELGLLLTPASAASVARFLKTTLGLDKAMLGEYLSKGPPDRYPFNGEVLREYARLFDFRDTPFEEALRRFLKEFRLPGEAQCIDRLMEAFACEYFRQCKGQHPFADADAAFILAFSIIMLNTDRHNPQIRDDKRMSKEDFVRNNRQINAGQDLPLAFLEAIYDSIADSEIAVQRDHFALSVQEGAGPIDYALHWDGILNRSRSVTLAAFTPAAARKAQFSAGVHERDMFTSIAERALQAIVTVFERSRDDALVLKALHGLHCYGKVCTYFGMVDPFNALLVSLFRYGNTYMAEAAAGEHRAPHPALLATAGLPDTSDIEALAPLAQHAHAHRGLLALKSALELLRAQGAAAQGSAWSALCEALLGLCDLRALPASLSDVDDFSDAAGAPLPPSQFATRCRNRAAGGGGGGGRHAGAHGGAGAGGRRGLFGGLSNFLWSSGGTAEGHAVDPVAAARADAVAALSQVVATCHVEQLFPASKDLPVDAAKAMLRALLSARDPSAVGGGSSADSGGGGGGSAAAAAAANFEGHAVLALELGSRVVLANRHRVEALWPLMHAYVERVFGSQAAVSRLPFLVERLVVTVLRSCIHLLDQSRAAAPPLLASLALLQHLPPAILEPLGDRVATGLLALVQANAAQLDEPRRWEIVTALLARAAAAPQGRDAAWEATAYLAERGPLTPSNVRPIFQLLVRFLEGNFGADAAIPSVVAAQPPAAAAAAAAAQQQVRDFGWTAPALKALATFVLTLTGAPGSGGGGGGGSPQSARFPLSPPPPGSVPPLPHAPVLNQMQMDSLWETSVKLSAPLLQHRDSGVSKAAAACVHRLLHQSAVTSPVAWHAVFMHVLLRLPLGPSMVREGDAKGDGGGGALVFVPVAAAAAGGAEGSEELYLRCCTLVSRALLQNLPLLSALPGFNRIWLTLLALLGTNISATVPGAVIHETCQQIITNMIMVVAHAGVFDAWTPAAGKPRDLLLDTWTLVDPVCPSIRPLFGPVVGMTSEAQPATVVQGVLSTAEGGAAVDGSNGAVAEGGKGAVEDTVEVADDSSPAP